MHVSLWQYVECMISFLRKEFYETSGSFSLLCVCSLNLWIFGDTPDGAKSHPQSSHCLLACPSALSCPWTELLTNLITHFLRKVLPCVSIHHRAPSTGFSSSPTFSTFSQAGAPCSTLLCDWLGSSPSDTHCLNRMHPCLNKDECYTLIGICWHTGER